VLVDFNRPANAGRETEYVAQAIGDGRIAGDGRFTKSCQEVLERALGVPKVLLTTSCTAALEMSALLADIGPGDEVIVPSFAFVSAANAFALRGARIVFADIRADTLNIDETKLEPLMSPRTKAVVALHYAGVACEMDAILDISRRHGALVVEDNAHGLFGKYKGRMLGSIGTFGAHSFHETKNITCGEGGALAINDADLIRRAETAWQKGTDRLRYDRGQVDKYTWVSLGSSYLPSEILAAYLYAQLECRERIQRDREIVWNRYEAGLREWASANGISTPTIPEHCEQAFHLFYLLLPTSEDRDAFIRHLADRQVNSVFHYTPLHNSGMGRTFGGDDPCPVTESVSSRLVRLPFYTTLTEDDQARVIAAARSFRARS